MRAAIGHPIQFYTFLSFGEKAVVIQAVTDSDVRLMLRGQDLD